MSDDRKKPTAVSDLLKQGQGKLHELRAAASEAQRTLAAVRECLPEPLPAQVWGATLRDGTLTLLVRSGAWGTRIRYRAAELRPTVAQSLAAEIARVVVKVRPPP